jgi:hypothetical protein
VIITNSNNTNKINKYTSSQNINYEQITAYADGYGGSVRAYAKM